jgi:phage protein D
LIARARAREASMPEEYYSSTAPTFKVGGSLKGELARDLLRLDVEEDTEGLKTLQAHFVAVGPATQGGEEQPLYIDGQVLDFGKSIEVEIGAPSNRKVIFKGTVSALELTREEGQLPRVTCFAEDGLMKLRMTRRMKTYENKTDAGIASAIGGEHGLTTNAAADGPSYDVVQQWNQSDLAFLRDRARLVQAEVWFADGAINFKTRANRSGNTVTLVYGNHLIDVRVRADLAHQRTTIKVSGYDAKQRAQIEDQADKSAIQAEVSGGVVGPEVLANTLGTAVSHRICEAPLVLGDATAWAKAEMLERSRGFVTVLGTTRGTPEMSVGSTLTFERVGKPYDGAGYYATSVRQSYDLNAGHRTHFRAERATLNK